MASIIESLCAHKLEHLVVDIFLRVSSKDWANVKLACKAWRDFVHEWIEGSVSGRKRLKQKLLNNWLAPPSKWKNSFCMAIHIYSLKWEADEMVMGSNDGEMIIVNTKSWEETYLDCFSRGSTIKFDLNADHIVAIDKDEEILLIERQPIQVVYKHKPRNASKGALWGVHIWKHLVAIGGRGGILVYKIESKRLNLLHYLRHHSGEVFRLVFHHGLIVTGSRDRLIQVYDYDQSTVVRFWTSPFDIHRLDLVYPIVVACSGQGGDENGIQIWSLDQEPGSDALKCVNFPQKCLDLKMTADHLAIAFDASSNQVLEPDWDDQTENEMTIIHPYKLKVWRFQDFLHQVDCPPIQEFDSTRHFETNIYMDAVSVGYSRSRCFTTRAMGYSRTSLRVPLFYPCDFVNLVDEGHLVTFWP